ncbi:MAG TPA: hypothetical protein PLY73_00915 [Candidatus Ozemobacteraceae bacterium]|nr:hypothetical protein [Candidatus Ozemobacteraceae bacterium]
MPTIRSSVTTAVRMGFGLTEALMAVLLFGILCLPLYRLYFKEGISQQRMIRDFLGVTNVSEKVMNRLEHQLAKVQRSLSPLHKEITPHVLIGLEEGDDWGFLGQSFGDDSGRLALKYIPAFKAEAELHGFLLDDSAVTSDHRANNPEMLKDVLKSINDRSQMLNVDLKWLDQAQIKHEFRLSYITTLRPEFPKAK